MNARRRICVVTSSRAEYGLLKGLLCKLQADPAAELQLVVTAAHLQDAFGRTVGEIEADRFPIAAKVPLPLDGSTPIQAATALGLGVRDVAEQLSRLSPHLVVVLGDRIELLAVASACLVLRIPMAHIHGGEASEGAIDDIVRHALTKMSHLHFAAAEPYRRRILQMGEMPERVFLAGAPGLDNVASFDAMSRSALECDLGLDIRDPLIVATCHPETNSSDPAAPASAMLAALSHFPDATVVFTKANADPGGHAINELIQAWTASCRSARLFDSLGLRRYLSLLKLAAMVVGNSSSGIIEAPAMGMPTVDIGNRQKGRLKASSVIECAADATAITQAIRRAMSAEFRAAASRTIPPYGRHDAADVIHHAIMTCDLGTLLKKHFVDQPVA